MSTPASPISFPPIEGEHLPRFRLSGSHAAVRIHSVFKRDDLDGRGFQGSRFKTRLQLAFDFRYLLCRQSIAVDSQQLGGVVIEVDEIEADARISRA